MTLAEAVVTGLVVGCVSVVGNYFGNKYLLKQAQKIEEHLLRGLNNLKEGVKR
jgi:hypothetical protein